MICMFRPIDCSDYRFEIIIFFTCVACLIIHLNKLCLNYIYRLHNIISVYHWSDICFLR